MSRFLIFVKPLARAGSEAELVADWLAKDELHSANGLTLDDVFAPDTEAVMISDASRLCLYVVMGVGPIWQDFFTKSSDYSFRGLAMPLVSTLVTASAVILAKTSSKKDSPEQSIPVEVTNTPSNPLPVTETKQKKP